jgi:hypothetical protein
MATGRDRTPWSRLLAAIIAATVAATPVLACSSDPSAPQPTTADLFRDAKRVFLARMVRTEARAEPDSHGWPVVEGRYRILETFKGRPDPNGAVLDPAFGPGNCALGLLAGSDHGFFVNEVGDVVLTTGSRIVFNRAAEPVKQLLAELRGLPQRPK